MSATIEFILEQIRSTENAVEEARLVGDSVSVENLERRLQNLRDQFKVSSSALNEGKFILKG